MKQILNINLGGYPITIDTDAYEHLSKYLDTIENHFKASDAAEEILSDIESRMAELFKENIHPRTIVTMPDVKSAIDIMGTPEMFGAGAIDDDDIPQSSASAKKKKKSKSGFNPGKRLFRDPDDKLLGGVSSGLAAYLGVADPIWLRIAFLAFTLLGFASLPIYIILWIVMPVAKTSADRLAMKGEPINVESIASSVVNELEHFSEKINDQFGSNKKKNGGRSRVNTQWIAALGGVLSTVIIGISQAARPILKILGGVLIVALLLGWVAIVVSAIVGVTKASFFYPSNTIAFSLGMVGIFLLVGAPILGLILTILRVFFKRAHAVGWRWSLLGLWLFGLFSFSFAAAKISDAYEVQSTYQQTVPVVAPKDAPLVVSFDKVFIANNDARSTLMKNIKVDFDLNFIRLNIEPAPDGQMKLIQVQTARGSDAEDAMAGAKKFEYNTVLAGNTLRIPSNYFIPKGERFRVQEVEMTLYVPVGQRLMLDEKLRKLDLHMSSVSGAYGDLFGEEVVMMDGGLKPLSTSLSVVTPKVGQAQVLSFDDFSKIDVEGPVALNVQQGKTFRVKIRGSEEGDPINLKVVDGELLIDVAKKLDKELEVFITMPSLGRLAAKNTHDIHIAQFKEEQMELELEGDMMMELAVDIDRLVVGLEGDVNLILKGKTKFLKLEMENATRIDGKALEVQRAEIDVAHQASADIVLDGEARHYGER